jgi:starch synthase
VAGLAKAGGPGEVSVGLVPLPIADATGGLANTIDDGMTGFLLSTLWSDGLMAACHRTFDTRDDGAELTDIRGPAMAGHFGWSGAAAKNEAL